MRERVEWEMDWRGWDDQRPPHVCGVVGGGFDRRWDGAMKEGKDHQEATQQ